MEAADVQSGLGDGDGDGGDDDGGGDVGAKLAIRVSLCRLAGG